MYEESLEARKSTTSVTSLGLPKRGIDGVAA
jgi:hypothetical protein